MQRAPFNVLVIAYRERTGRREYAVFHRADCEMWQFIAGGGEDDEQPAATARREAFEEAGIDGERTWIALDATTSIPRTAYPDASWPPDILVIPEISFAVHAPDLEIQLSPEHDRVEWLEFESARDRLTWDSNRVALWELQQRLRPRELRTDRLWLRAMRAADEVGYAELLADPGTHPFITESGPVPASDIAARIRRNRDSVDATYWAVEHDGEFVGYVALHDRTLSYAVRPAWRRQGIAREALAAVCKLVPEPVARTHLDNEPSARLLAGLGFREHGVVQTDFGPRREFRRMGSAS